MLAPRLNTRLLDDYAKVPEMMREGVELQILALVMNPAVEWVVMDVLDEWERLTGLTVDSALLDEVAITLLEQRRYARAVLNAIKYSPNALHFMRERFPAHRPLLERARADTVNPHLLEKLRDFIFTMVGKEDFESHFMDAMGYDLPADLARFAPYSAIGEVLDLPASEAAFKEAMQARKHWEFSKFSVTQTVSADGNRWLVFFV